MNPKACQIVTGVVQKIWVSVISQICWRGVSNVT